MAPAPPHPPTGPHVLGLPARRAMLAAVRDAPGVSLGALRRALDLGWGNAYHHLRRLERAGLVHSARLGRRLVVYPAAADEHAGVREARAYLLGRAACAVCADIAAHPGTDVAAIASRTGLSQRAVYYHVRAALRLGLVVSRSPARQFALHPTALYALARPSGAGPG